MNIILKKKVNCYRKDNMFIKLF